MNSHHEDLMMRSTRDSSVMTEKLFSVLEGAAANVGGAAFAERAQMRATFVNEEVVELISSVWDVMGVHGRVLERAN